MNIELYKSVFQQLKKPFAFVDLNTFDQNLEALVAQCGEKDIRIATKSIRSMVLLQRISNKIPNVCWMCFSIDEAVMLAENGFDNLLVAYPSLQQKAVERVCEQIKKGKKIYLMTDNVWHLKNLDAIALKNNVVLPVAVDIDVSMNFMGIYFGVYRSSIRTTAQFKKYLDALPAYKNVTLKGVMTYEAQIAGVGDNSKGKFFYNKIITFLKQKSLPKIEKTRAELKKQITEAGVTLDFFNGGGTGSLTHTSKDKNVSEITFGSGLFTPTLFDNYKDFKGSPATGFVLEVCRHPQKNVYTALGGGYVASGSAGIDKLPKIMYPKSAKLFTNEGVGEVQTPFKTQSPIDFESEGFAVFRHAKAGELCERFSFLYGFENQEKPIKIPTYRGEGYTFL